MRNYHLISFTCLCLLVLTSNRSFAQVEWEALLPHNHTSVELLYVAKNHELIGYLEFPASLVVSSDNGRSWDLFYEGPYLESYLYVGFDLAFTEDKDGTYYVSINRQILRYNDQSEDLETVINLEEITSVYQMAFLPNGNLVAVDFYGNVEIYNNEFEIVATNNFGYFHTELAITDSDFHFAYRPNTKTYTLFNNDLSDLEYDLEYPDGQIIYSKGRMLSSGGYSDDGMNWNYYKWDGNRIEGPNILITIDDEGKVILFEDNYKYTSSDNGSSFERELIPPLPFADDLDEVKIYSVSEQGIILYKSDKLVKEDEELFYSDDGSTGWVKADLKIGNPTAISVEVATESNIFVETFDRHNYKQYFIHSGSAEWASYSIEACIDFLERPSTSYNIESFTDGTLLSSGLCISSDEGLSWTPLDQNIYFNNPSDHFIVNDTIYSGSPEFIKSGDKGETWEQLPDLLTCCGFYFHGVSHVGNIFYSYPDELDNEWYHLKYVASEDRVKSFYLSCSNRCEITGFTSSEYSPDVFILVDSKELRHSVDDGNSFVHVDLSTSGIDINPKSRITMDKTNNLILWDDKSVFCSSDLGKSWLNISPTNKGLIKINNIEISHDNHIYLACDGVPILKSKKSNLSSNSISEDSYTRINVFPNPASDVLTIVKGNRHIEQYELLDLSGRVMKAGRFDNDKRTISVKELNKGLYILRLKGLESGACLKVMVSR